MAIFKTHIALKVSDLVRSVEFYKTLFSTQPVKYKAGYAKFDIANPRLNLTLNESGRVLADGTLSHLGIQVDSTETVRDVAARLKTAGLTLAEEFDTDCCYALQDKVWVVDPDGNRWEVFVIHVTDTAPDLEINPAASQPNISADGVCCVPACCT